MWGWFMGKYWKELWVGDWELVGLAGVRLRLRYPGQPPGLAWEPNPGVSSNSLALVNSVIQGIVGEGFIVLSMDLVVQA
ncbi:hypothetical protein EDF88_3769 [Buttiauxella sp. BIGb0552]|nr:hypothetical protein EDF88_3769 [Buttiauxella sp. BIGb0552]